MSAEVVRAAPRAADVAAAFAARTPREVMAQHAKTFYWASRFFPRAIRRDIEALYWFCRFVDDVADETGDVEPTRAALGAIANDLSRGRSEMPPVAAFLDLARRKDIAVGCAEELVRGALGDLGRVRVATQDELLLYAYRVASTVGLMVCGVVDVRDATARHYAIDLGAAMQLTNIARDVVDDAARDRVYLPAAWIDAEVVMRACGDAGDEAARTAVLHAVYDLLDLASAYYRSADHGMAHLPWWARVAILTASRSYEAIGGVIRTRGVEYWSGRSYTRRRSKLRHTLAAVAMTSAKRWLRDRSLTPPHRSSLHAALAGLPYANCGQSDCSCANQPPPLDRTR